MKTTNNQTIEPSAEDRIRMKDFSRYHTEKIDRRRYIPSKQEYIKDFFKYLEENEYWNDCSPYEK